MDLTRLYNLTTPELREEAERLGVSDTYALSRAQLIHAIRNEVGGSPAAGLFGRVLGLAKWALQSAGPGSREEPAEEAPSAEPEEGGTDEPRREPTMRFIRPSYAPPSTTPPSSPPPIPSVAPSSSPPPAPAVATPASVPGSASASASVPGSAPVSAPAPPVPAPTTAPPEPAPTTAPPAPLEPAGDTAQASLDKKGASRAPAGVFSSSGGPYEEPFPTRTMARILAEQGHYKRALAIYATLMHDEPDDLDLREEADAVQSRSRARRSHVH